MRPVYLINGFLESGKTSFIRFTLQQPYFQIKGTTLLLLCEEGEEEYDDKLLKQSNTIKHVLEDEEDFDAVRLVELEKKYNAERIIIEYNGMWNMKDLVLPFHWNLEQQITCIDASTFPTYYNNMKSMVAEMVRKSELIIFNRCDTVMDNLASYRRNIKAVNASADVVFENAEGEINEIFEEDLPYDLKSERIELDDNSYGIWYMDMMDHAERYFNKTIAFTAMVMKPPRFPKGAFVPGRMAMTCCAEDMTFLGYVCKYDKADEVKDRSWVKVEVSVKKEFWKDYKGEGPVLYASKVEPAEKPKQEVIGF
ncbi:MAG: GTPase [Lachnospiraceae bacterium]|nr:GTPase [Lachnospiraceae bacterium]MBO6297485.1 GTPase [Lachnospiraceae bacterium]MBP3296965.1 GTPase [Lachnospiraceae bacterium]